MNRKYPLKISQNAIKEKTKKYNLKNYQILLEIFVLIFSFMIILVLNIAFIPTWIARCSSAIYQ